MAKLYLLGGERVSRRDAQDINLAAFQDAGDMPRVLVFSWARASFDRTFRRRRTLFDYLRSMGAREVRFADFSEPFGDIAQKVADSDLVYLAGGQLSILISRLRKTGVDKLLLEYKGVILGRSAGALVLGRYGMVTNRYNGSAKMVQGLGLFDFSVKVHYKPAKDAILENFSKKEKIFAIPERSALVYNEGSISSLGECVFLFDKGKKTIINGSYEDNLN